jgi:hypothetical protein
MQVQKTADMEQKIIRKILAVSIKTSKDGMQNKTGMISSRDSDEFTSILF